MKRHYTVLVLLVAAMFLTAGCGNVRLTGQAQIAAEVSTSDAHAAFVKADANPDCPSWIKAYLCENFKQWRFFVRSDRGDDTWGLRLPSEADTPPTEK